MSDSFALHLIMAGRSQLLFSLLHIVDFRNQLNLCAPVKSHIRYQYAFYD